MDKPSWDDLQAFERVARHGSLSAAARALGVSQPTLSRQMQRLEKQTQRVLFHRHIHGVALTDEGKDILKIAQAMREKYDAHWFELDQNHALKGTVRITASHFVSQFLLAEIVAKIRKDAPEIELEIYPNDAAESLSFRDVDIAIRHFESVQAELISKPLGRISIGCYGAKSYFRAHEIPKSVEALTQHSLVGYQQRDEIQRAMRAFEAERKLEFGTPSFGIRTDHDPLNWALVKAGAGLGFAQSIIGDADADVVRVLPEIDFAQLPVWLVGAQTQRFVPRLRFVWEALSEALQRRIQTKTR